MKKIILSILFIFISSLSFSFTTNNTQCYLLTKPYVVNQQDNTVILIFDRCYHNGKKVEGMKEFGGVGINFPINNAVSQIMAYLDEDITLNVIFENGGNIDVKKPGFWNLIDANFKVYSAN